MTDEAYVLRVLQITAGGKLVSVIDMESVVISFS